MRFAGRQRPNPALAVEAARIKGETNEALDLIKRLYVDGMLSTEEARTFDTCLRRCLHLMTAEPWR